MSCDAPLYSILKSWLLGMHTCSEHVCSGSNCRRDEHIASLPPTPVLTDMKGAAWAGYHGNRCTLHSLAAAVGFWCRRVFPEPRLDTIAVFNGMFSILLSLLPRPPRPPSNSLCGMTALSCQSSPLFQDGSQPRGRRGGCCIRGVMIMFSVERLRWNVARVLVLIGIIRIHVSQSQQLTTQHPSLHFLRFVCGTYGTTLAVVEMFTVQRQSNAVMKM